MSQPWQDSSRASGPAEPGGYRPSGGTASAWAAGEPDLAGGAPWEPEDDAGDGALDWTPAPGQAAAGRDPGQHSAGGEHPGPRLTSRGAIAGMLVAFFLGLLLESWLHWGVLAGGSFLAGSLAAAWYTKERALLAVVVTPPLLFFADLVLVKALTATGNTLLSTAEGTALTLASSAPWLFAGVILSVALAWFRGLPRCVADLRRELHPRSGVTSR